MSKVEITELGRKWYGVCVSFDEADIDRISPDSLRGLGGKLRYDNDGGFRALFHFNVTKKENSEAMLQVLKYFGAEGYFQKGMDIVDSTAPSVSESPEAMTTVLDFLKSNCKVWAEQWKKVTESGVVKKFSRIQTLRSIRDLGIGHVSEENVREYIEEILRKKYASELFVETFMWRLGWPDKRKPFASIQSTKPLSSAV